jgi:hypothetical protein
MAWRAHGQQRQVGAGVADVVELAEAGLQQASFLPLVRLVAPSEASTAAKMPRCAATRSASEPSAPVVR